MAETAFVENGFRGTTFEGVAKIAGMSKVTVYGYFKDKEALFAAVAEDVAGRMKAAVIGALDETGPIGAKVAHALVAKHGIIFQIVRSSKFSADLFAAKNRIVTLQFQELDIELEAMIADCLREGGVFKEEAQSQARLLFAASQGIANRASGMREAEHDIRVLVEALTDR